MILWNENRYEADQTAAVLPLSRGSQRGSEQAHSQAEFEAEFEADQTTPNPSYSGGEGCAAKEPISSEEKSTEVPKEPKEPTSSEGKPILPISSDDKPISSEEKPNETEKSPEDVIRELDQKIADYAGYARQGEEGDYLW